MTAASPAEIAPISRTGRRLGRIVRVVAVLAALGMVASGLVPQLVYGRVSGWVLLLHTGVSPVFLLSIALWSARYAGRLRAGTRSAGLVERASFWAIVVASLVLGVTMLSVMSSMVGSDVQAKFIVVHRIAAFAFVAAAIVFIASALRRGRVRRA